MAAFSLPVNRAAGRALIIGSVSCRAAIVGTLDQLGYQATEVDDPYAAMAEICRRPLVYRAIFLSLASTYREELQLIAAIKRRCPQIEIWLCHVDARAAALAEASRLGADGLLAEDGLHRFAASAQQPAVTPLPTTPVKPTPPAAPPSKPPPAPEPAREPRVDAPLVDIPVGEPVLTADELRALLQEPALRPPAPREDE